MSFILVAFLLQFAPIFSFVMSDRHPLVPDIICIPLFPDSYFGTTTTVIEHRVPLDVRVGLYTDTVLVEKDVYDRLEEAISIKNSSDEALKLFIWCHIASAYRTDTVKGRKTDVVTILKKTDYYTRNDVIKFIGTYWPTSNKSRSHSGYDILIDAIKNDKIVYYKTTLHLEEEKDDDGDNTMTNNPY